MIVNSDNIAGKEKAFGGKENAKVSYKQNINLGLLCFCHEL